MTVSHAQRTVYRILIISIMINGGVVIIGDFSVFRLNHCKVVFF